MKASPIGAARGALRWVALASAFVACGNSEPSTRRGPDTASRAVPAQSAVGDQSASVGTSVSTSGSDDAAVCTVGPVPTRLPPADRIVAIGDLHGDLLATRAALRLAGAIDESDAWIGGALVLVQTGDVLDRGDGEQAIMDLFNRLETSAKAAGGRVVILNGNHELMNALGDFRYVTRGGFRDFEDVAGLDVTDPGLAMVAPPARARVAAVRPGGIYARRMAEHNVAVVIGNTIFAHGGVTPAYANRLEVVNRSIRCWLSGAGEAPDAATDADGPVWTREFSRPPEQCAQLVTALELAGVKRMVVGHTTQRHANAGCNGRVWRIDVGMAAYYGGPIEVLELRGDVLRVLSAPRPDANAPTK